MLLVIDGIPRGIRCDLTGKELFDKFTYYSLEGRMVTIDGSRKIITNDPEVSLDLDICEDAYNKLYETVKTNISKVKPGYIKCDLSDRFLEGSFKYWAIIISQVLVDLDMPEPMTVNKAMFDLNASYEEVMKLIDARNENRKKPFIPKNVTKREVIKLSSKKDGK